MEIVDYLLARKKAGGGSDVTIEQLSVTENGTYSEQGIAYSPVVVNVPAPANSYQLTDIPSGAVSTIEDGTDLPMSSLKVGIEPVQDLHGYDHPWVGGAGKNIFNPETYDNIPQYTINDDGTITAQASDGGMWEQRPAIPLKAGTYTASFSSKTGGSLRYKISEDNYSEEFSTTSSKTFTLSSDGGIKFKFAVAASSYPSVVKVQLEQGSTATSYEPYSNICPISGWTAANVTRSGKNLFDQSSFEWEYSESQIKYVTMPIPNGTYTFSTNMPDRDTNIRDVFVFAGQVESGASSPINGVSVISPRTITVTDGHYTIASRYGSIVDDYNWQLELGTTATTYEPYNGQTYTIQFKDGDNPLTVYGGTLDVVNGELTVDRAGMDLGTIYWGVYNATRRIFMVNINNAKVYQNNSEMPNILVSQYMTVKGDDTWINGIASMYQGSNGIVICDTRYTDVISFKTAMNGVQLVYELAEPITYHLTPTQIRTLVGNNNIWADTGDIIEGKYFKEL